MSYSSSHDDKRLFLHIHKKDDPTCFWACRLDNPKLAYAYGIAADIQLAHAFTYDEVVSVAEQLVTQFESVIELIEGVPCETERFLTPAMRKTLNLV